MFHLNIYLFVHYVDFWLPCSDNIIIYLSHILSYKKIPNILVCPNSYYPQAVPSADSYEYRFCQLITDISLYYLYMPSSWWGLRSVFFIIITDHAFNYIKSPIFLVLRGTHNHILWKTTSRDNSFLDLFVMRCHISGYWVFNCH